MEGPRRRAGGLRAFGPGGPSSRPPPAAIHGGLLPVPGPAPARARGWPPPPPGRRGGSWVRMGLMAAEAPPRSWTLISVLFSSIPLSPSLAATLHHTALDLYRRD